MTTSTFYADESDGEIEYNDYNQQYTAFPDGIYGQCGRDNWIEGLDEFQFLARWDTLPIGSDEVTAVTLSMWLSADLTDDDAVLEARLHTWGPTLTTADWVSNKTGKTLVAHKDTAGWGGIGAYKDFIDDAFPANINKSGYTDIIIMHDWSAITGQSFVRWIAANQSGTNNDPKLVVTHSGEANIKIHSVDSWLKKEQFTQNTLSGTSGTKITRENSAGGGDSFSVVSP